MIVRSPLSVPDHSSVGQAIITHVVIPAGVHLVETIPNPWPGRGNDSFITLVGTKIGAGRLHLLSLSEGENSQITFDPPMVSSLGSGSSRDQMILAEINDKLLGLEKLIPGLSVNAGNSGNFVTLRNRLVTLAERVDR